MGALMDLVKVLFEPTAVFERVREKPKFLVPFAGIAVIQIVVGFLQLPFLKAAMASQFAEMAQQNPQAAAMAQRFMGVGLVVAPIILAIILLLSAFILWVLVSVMGGEAKFRTLLSVATYAAMTAMLLQLIGVVVLMVKGTGGISSPQDLQPALGLDLLMPGAKGILGGILKGINPFGIWGLVLTAIGVSTTHKLSKGTGYTVATIQFVIGLLIAGALTGLRRG